MPGNLSGRTDGRAEKRSRLFGWGHMWKDEMVSGFGRTEGQSENINNASGVETLKVPLLTPCRKTPDLTKPRNHEIGCENDRIGLGWSGDVIQYKDAILPLAKIPLWKYDDLMTLSPQGDFLYW